MSPSNSAFRSTPSSDELVRARGLQAAESEHHAIRASVSAPLINTDEAAALLNVPRSWIAEQARHNRIPNIMLGKYRRFDRDELLEWARKRQRGPGTLSR
jgi:excisionase family DNA binding protein